MIGSYLENLVEFNFISDCTGFTIITYVFTIGMYYIFLALQGALSYVCIAHF